MKTGDRAAATRAESDEMRVIAATASQVAATINATGQASAKTMPIKVATPLPPLKLSQDGKDVAGEGAECRD